MLGIKGLEGDYCSFHGLEGVCEAFQVHREEYKERLDVILP